MKDHKEIVQEITHIHERIKHRQRLELNKQLTISKMVIESLNQAILTGKIVNLK